MNYSFYPAVKQCVYEQDWCQIDQLSGAVSSSVPGSAEMEKLPMALRPLPEQAGAGFYY